LKERAVARIRYSKHAITSLNKQTSYKIMKMQMFATLDRVKRDTGNISSLNLAAINHKTVQVNRLLL
jgi:hypothetical protein